MSEFEVRRVRGSGKRLLFIHGYGGNFEQPGVRWLMNRFERAGLDVTYIKLPTVMKDFRKDLLEPCLEVEEEMSEHVAAGFSLGGLVLAYMSSARKRMFLSPFWGVNERWMHRGAETAVRLLSVISKPMVPRHFEKEEAGGLAEDDDMEGIPRYLTFGTIDQFFAAQKGVPAARDDDVVFYSPDDRIISIRRIEESGIRSHRFRGGHMFYLTRDRERTTDLIMSEIDGKHGQTHSAI